MDFERVKLHYAWGKLFPSAPQTPTVVGANGREEPGSASYHEAWLVDECIESMASLGRLPCRRIGSQMVESIRIFDVRNRLGR